MHRFVSGFLALLGIVTSQTSVHAQPLPNVVVIYFDDTGWTDFGCFGGDVDTPNVDKLASEGMRFTEYYAPAPNCSPSRTGLLTGRFPFRVGMYSYLAPDSVMHLPNSEVTIAEVLKTQGYATGVFGKWHLSSLNSQQPGPADQGFDYWFACDNNLVKRNPRSLIRNGTPVPKTDGWAAQVVADEANGWMRTQDRPFFAYVAFSETHSPHDAPTNLKEKYAERGNDNNRATYKAITEYTDSAVGSILKTLDDLGVSDNTIVFLASDNGPTSDKSCVGLRGRKSFTWEGGVRVPAIMRWPGKITPGSEHHGPVGGIDLLPTLCDIVGAELPPKKIDGVSLRPLLEGKSFTRTAPILTFFYRTSPAASMRLGDYVLIGHSDDESREKTHAAGAEDMPKIKSAKLVSFELYNVKTDLAQQHDLAESQPERLAGLRGVMVQLHRDAIDEGPVWQLREIKPRKNRKEK
ncbi:sulfatase-like hydrolase/transferase [Aporhodopirellula aestuarii]|uniref:Sulfatase-like hydrolase/transferase n=1 Tax=Aporhodopirellula aestuarii TaxID=2950107 RepID=A0ABT0TY27_9BACT|nr:sulfatase-like hydrolase/transferase [Aporhodopirellula aestuarii]MCM2369496.1 sulfatase-like hydrolase/transferase [Aporhodopirellula aestuarii]